MDTRNDFRILVAIDALERLKKMITGQRLHYPYNKHKAKQLLTQLHSLLMQTRYSMLPANILIQQDYVKEIKNKALELAKTILPPKQQASQIDRATLAELRYSLRILIGLPARLLLGDENKPEYAIDIEAAKILSVHKHPNADKLYLTRAQARYATHTIVTNIQDIKEGEIRAIAFLPPAIIRGELSEAMYCSDPLQGIKIGQRPPPDKLHLNELRAKIIQITKKYAQ